MNIFLDKQKPVTLQLTFGTPKFGFEMRLVDKEFHFDLFFIERVNSTHQWNSYYEGNTLFQLVFHYHLRI